MKCVTPSSPRMLLSGILYSAPQIFTNTVEMAITVTPPMKDCFFSLDMDRPLFYWIAGGGRLSW